MAQCATSVGRLYKSVIEEIIANVRDDFLDDGIDEQVLMDMKQAWEQKLAQTRCTEHDRPNGHQMLSHQVAGGIGGAPARPPPAPVTQVNLVPVQITVPAPQAGGTAKTITIHVPSSSLSNGVAGQELQTILSAPSAAPTFSLDANQAAEIIQRQLNEALQRKGIVVPQQLMRGVLQQDGAGGSGFEDITQNHNAGTFMKEKQPDHITLTHRKKKKQTSESNCHDQSRVSEPSLNSNNATATPTVIDGTDSSTSIDVISAFDNLCIPSDYVSTSSEVTSASDNVPLPLSDVSADVTVHASRHHLDAIVQRAALRQEDGACDGGSSDEMSGSEDDDDVVQPGDEDDPADKLSSAESADELADGAVAEEPLNSADDLTDDETTVAFDTENVVVCQYDKITRTRNRWKFSLKDGVMSIKNKDYVFVKASGEGEW